MYFLLFRLRLPVLILPIKAISTCASPSTPQRVHLPSYNLIVHDVKLM